MEYICKYCGRKCKNLNSLTQHEIRCHSNPNRITNCGNHGATKGYPGYNHYIKAKLLGLPKPKISEETRKKLSIASKKYNNYFSRAKRKIIFGWKTFCRNTRR